MFRDRKERTVVVRLPRRRDGFHLRKDLLFGLKRVLRSNKIEALGQLENNLRWEVVLSDETAKQRLLASPKLPVGDYEATLEPLFQTTRRLRITRVPMCIPNEYLRSLLVQRKVKVFRMELEVNKEDGLMSNTRTAVVSTDDWENVPDRLSWELGGLRGTALLYLQGRPPRCYRCLERGHKFYECPYPFCTRCRRVGHTEDDGCGPLSYAERTSGDTRRDEIDDMELQGDDTEEGTEEAGQTEAEASQNPGSAETKETNEQTPSDNINTAIATASAAPPHTAADNTTDVVANATLTTDADISSDGGDDGDRETESEALQDDGYQQPREQRRRHRRTKRRAATSGDSAGGDGQLKKRKDVASDVEPKSRSVDEPQLDPTLGRRHSFSRIPTGRRQQ